MAIRRVKKNAAILDLRLLRVASLQNEILITIRASVVRVISGGRSVARTDDRVGTRMSCSAVVLAFTGTHLHMRMRGSRILLFYLTKPSVMGCLCKNNSMSFEI